MTKLLASAFLGGIALFPALSIGGLAQAASIPPIQTQTQITSQVSPSADQAWWKEYNPHGLAVSSSLSSIMPANVASKIANGATLIGVTVQHYFFSQKNGVTQPTSLSHWEKLHGMSQYNVVTSSLINNWTNSGSQNMAQQPNTVVGPPPGSNGSSGTYDGNQLSIIVWITQNSTTSINYTFNGQALWSNYDTVTGYTDYQSLVWWPNEASQAGQETRSAIGVNVNNPSQTITFPTQQLTASQNQYTISTPQTQYRNTVEYALEQVDWGVTVANPDFSPNDLNAGDMNGYYTQTWTGVQPSFSIGTSATLNIGGISEDNKWQCGPVNWSPAASQT
ncbi:MAG: hypothetical protein M1272_07400 [Firmicutes bacterium]|nr:hypothetical protein [Bacillota bacterium]